VDQTTHASSRSGRRRSKKWGDALLRPAAVDRRRDLLELGGGATPPRGAPSPSPPPSPLFGSSLDFALLISPLIPSLSVGLDFSLDSVLGEGLVVACRGRREVGFNLATFR